MEIIRQAILDTIGHLRPTSSDTLATELVQSAAQSRCGLALKVRQVMLDYRGEGFLTDYEYQGREYRTFWPLSQA